ncbi:AraC family transcriptional regulator [Synoicihabitans lomoniglobus]|uniref:AraC family transcriptional regulator n=1 Tax=Synoicihabitans lomoniglobus TaxID=2909285 RepID=A0AAF0I4Q1_9BACT|nr:AraC family transcriptional regulator [Opitutaceae bacterium LMO-M01]WED66958.1 AraC family transcriptional regulator [Opitutaceae bacterium LMO-M01]
MITSQPLEIDVPVHGAIFAESVHAADFHMTDRADAFHKVLFVQRGVVELRLTGRKRLVSWQADAGTLLVVPAGELHNLVDIEPSVLLLLGVGTAFVADDADLAALWARLVRREVGATHFRGDQAGPIVKRWRQAILEQTLQRLGGGVAVRILTLEMLLMADRCLPKSRTNTTADRLEMIRGEMEETFFEGWTIDRAAEWVGLSRRQFTQRFRELTGVTFVEFLNRLRLAHAERLMRSGQYSVIGAAFSSGFEDLSHFYRLFRGRHGKPPREWLREEAT